ncbi:MAG: MBG domain-containing protein, partial [bacterium]
MKTYLTDVLKVLIVTVFVTLATSSAQQVSITSVDLSGRMGFALSPTGTVADYACSVEWCSTLGNGWTNAWPHPFASFPLSNGTYSADLPRFFRILCATGTVAPGANAAYKVINSNIVARTQDGLISWTNNGDPKYFVEYAVGTNRVWLGDWVCQTNIHATADVTNHIELPMWFRVVAITQATAIVTLEALVQSYNGAARSVTATTTPTGLPVAITYAGLAWAPTNAGSYAVAATITDSNYTGVTNGILLVNKLSVVLTGVRTYDGTATASNSILSVSNKIGSDDVTVASGSGTLMSSNAGWRAFASLGTLTLGGAAAG